MIKLAIFLSGTGTNARNLCGYFAAQPDIEIVLLLTNKENSGAAAIASDYGLPYVVFGKDEFYHSGKVLEQLAEYQVDAVVLAGFLWLVPASLIERYPQRIINIHPALLPKYGGKGMFGKKVHEAVKAHGETETGITIHLCNEKYDEGDILFQARCPVLPEDTPESIGQKVQQLEQEFFPKVVEEYLSRKSFS